MVALRAAGPYYRRMWWLRGLVGLQGYTIGHHGSLEGYRAILQGTVVAARAAGPYYRAHGSWEGCRAILQATLVAGRAAVPY